MIKKVNFTLIELLIAVALSLVVTAMITSVYSQTGRVTKSLSMKARLHDEARTIMTVISQDLSGYFCDPRITQPIDGDGDEMEFTTCSIYSVATDLSLGSDSDDYLSAPYGHVRYEYDGTSLYRGVSSTWTKETTGSVDEFLSRSDSTNNYANGTTSITNEDFLMSSNITQFSIEYTDSSSGFQSSTGAIDPNDLTAIKITIQVEDPAQSSDASTLPVKLQKIFFINSQQ